MQRHGTFALQNFRWAPAALGKVRDKEDFEGKLEECLRRAGDFLPRQKITFPCAYNWRPRRQDMTDQPRLIKGRRISVQALIEKNEKHAAVK